VVVGTGADGLIYVLDDMSIDGLPPDWANRAITAYLKWDANLLVVEQNHGGDMVRHTISTVDPTVPLRMVTASRGKYIRAEPVAMLYEQGRVRHVGTFPELEDEMCSFTPDGLVGGGSPNHVDALVWAATDLAIANQYDTGAW
jgi:phage terminase large subunit-like protein